MGLAVDGRTGCTQAVHAAPGLSVCGGQPVVQYPAVRTQVSPPQLEGRLSCRQITHARADM
jgi:hypothetical protein